MLHTGPYQIGSFERIIGYSYDIQWQFYVIKIRFDFILQYFNSFEDGVWIMLG